MVLEFLIAASISGVVIGSILDRQGKAARALNTEQKKLVNEIQLRIEAQKYKEAIDLLNTLIKSMEKPMAINYTTLGMCHDRLILVENTYKNTTTAIRCYKKALALQDQGIPLSSDIRSAVQDRIDKLQPLLKGFDNYLLAFEKTYGNLWENKTVTIEYLEDKFLNRLHNPLISETKQKIEEALENSSYEEAVKHYDKLVKIEPKIGEHYFFRAIWKLKLHNDQGALEDFKAALEYDLPDKLKEEAKQQINILEVIPELYEKGCQAGNSGKYDEAIAIFSEIIDMDSNYGDALYYRGTAKALSGNKKGALEDFKMAMKLEMSDQSRKLCEKAIKELNSELKTSEHQGKSNNK